MSAGKSDAWTAKQIARSYADGDLSGESEWVEQSLLLDARADASAASHLAASFLLRAERAEALAGEYERDAMRYRFLRSRNVINQSLGPYIMIREQCGSGHVNMFASEEDADTAIDTAIDAVGGRGE